MSDTEEKKIEIDSKESGKAESNEGTAKNKNKKVLIGAAVAAVIVCASGLIGYRLYVNNRSNERFSQYQSDIETGAFDDALQVYEDYADDTLFKELSNSYLEEKTSSLSAEETDKEYLAALLDSNLEFSSKELLIESVSKTVTNMIADGKEKQENLDDLLETLDEYTVFVTPNMSGEISGAKGFFNTIINSQKSFAEAKELYETKKYYDAIDKYSAVVEEDNNYEEAQAVIRNSKDILKKEAISIANEEREKGNFESALSPLEQFLKYYDDAEVTSLKNEISEEKRIKEETERLTKWVLGSWKSLQGNGGTIEITEKTATIKGLSGTDDFVMNGSLSINVDEQAAEFAGTYKRTTGSVSITVNAILKMECVSDNEAKGTYSGTFKMNSSLFNISSRPFKTLNFDAVKVE